MAKPLRLILADDHALVRAGFRSLLNELPETEVVAEAENGRQALQLVAEHQPDMILMDIGMPELNGLEATGYIARDHPEVRVVILSMHMTEEYVLRALQAGAAGYLLKDADPNELDLAIRAVARGETYLSPRVSRHVISEYLDRVSGGTAGRAEDAPVKRLTPRQREVLQLIAEGFTSQDIANKLGISLKTVETHRYQLMDRLDIHDVAGLVRYAIRTGLISID